MSGCNTIEDFYESLKKTNEYRDIVSNVSIGPFGGKQLSYTVSSDVGPIKVRCNNGLDTLKMFSSLDIMLIGSVRGSSSSGISNISSEGSSCMATTISKVNSDGTCNVNTLFASSVMSLPMPVKK
jgi:hypothetical protein